MQSIAISSWSLNTFFKNGSMDWRSFCSAVRSFGLSHAELNNHFFESLDDDYIADLKQTLDAYGITVVNLAVDDGLQFAYISDDERKQWDGKNLGGGLSDADEEVRAFCIERIKGWIDIGHALGAQGVRNNTGGPVDKVDMDAVKRCADSFKQLSQYAATKNMKMIIENHGGISSNIDALDKVFELVDEPNLAQALDFGNWPANKRYESVERSTQRAGLIHPKTHAFDASGEQTEWDTYRMAHAVMQSGFQGPWVIEYESDEQDRFEGIQLSIDMIKRCFAA